ncbi:TAXI family TRAP transporter solute-binding subunit [Streptomyces sp. NPDC018031]|uniref:TAXI family TRAP transporter solute-binding subunit n=1 Tax=Streptomyces sp. NPDC018031 TaxID=3365033 RepID=UPI0037934DFF
MPALPRRVLLGALAAAPLAACAGGGPRGLIRLATGPDGGPYAVFGSRLADEVHQAHPDLTVRVVTTAASVQNLRLLRAGRAELALTLADSAADAAAGRGAFRPARGTGSGSAAPGPAGEPIAALARLYLNYLHLVVPADAEPREVADLAGHTLSLGAAGSGTSVTAERVLAAAGVRERVRAVRLGLGESAAALRAGRITAFFWSGGVPTRAIADLARHTPVRLVPLGTLAARLRRAAGPVYESAVIPAGAYGQQTPIPTVGTPSYLVCRRDLGEDAARAVTGVLFTHRDRLPVPDAPGSRLDERYAIGTGDVPLHPGAAAHYRSVYG